MYIVAQSDILNPCMIPTIAENHHQFHPPFSIVKISLGFTHAFSNSDMLFPANNHVAVQYKSVRTTHTILDRMENTFSFGLIKQEKQPLESGLASVHTKYNLLDRKISLSIHNGKI